jgi:S-adenosylmethionine hydrolase
MTPIITLLTDFGTQDAYVASMKGVILAINPRCRLIDITHEVRPHDVRAGALILAQAYSYFPKGSIHVCVVDPGVGSPRRPILLVTPRYLFLGPDNGLLTVVSHQENVKKAFALTRSKFFRPSISSTFHGRDIFAPVAGHLSLGKRPESFGSEIDSWVELDFGEPAIKGNELEGEISHVDGFGNLITNIREEVLVTFTHGRPFVIRAGRARIRGLRKAYWEGRKGEPIGLIGSGGFLEISVREGHARKVLKVRRGTKIRVRIDGGRK